MNINPISFGKAIKTNSSLEQAQQAANLINSNGKNLPIGEFKEVQHALARFFSDTPAGKAQTVQLENGDVYILSGQESSIYDSKKNSIETKYEKNKEECGAYWANRLKEQSLMALEVDLVDFINNCPWNVFSLNLSIPKRGITKAELIHDATGTVFDSSADFSYFA